MLWFIVKIYGIFYAALFGGLYIFWLVRHMLLWHIALTSF